MTISTTTRKAGPFTGNGVTTSFAFTFKVFQKADVLVVKLDALGVQSTLTLDSHYSVILNVDQDNAPGGTITYPISGAPLASTERLVIASAVSETQLQDITNGGGFFPRVNEDSFDKLTALVQQLREVLNRTPSAPITDPAGLSYAYPSVEARASRLLAFDSVGNVVPSAAVTGSGDSVLTDLANSSNTTLGSSLVAFPDTFAPAFVKTLSDIANGLPVSITRFMSAAERTNCLNGVGTTDVTARIQDAINAARSVFMPSGRYLSGPVTFGAAASKALYGEGYGDNRGAIIVCRDATGDLITVYAGLVEIHGLRFVKNTTRTSGAYIKLNTGNCTVRNFWMDDAAIGVNINATGSRVDRGYINPLATTGIGVQVNSGADVAISNMQIISAVKHSRSIDLINTQDTTLLANQCINAVAALAIFPGVGQAVSGVRVLGGYYDTSTRGLDANPQSATSSITRCKAVGVWFSGSSSTNVRLLNTNGGTHTGWDFIGCDAILSAAADGYSIGTNVSEIRIEGGESAANAGSGISFAGSGLTVVGHRCGTADGLAGNTFGGIVVDAAATNITIRNNDLRGNVGAGLQDNSGATTKNIGDNTGVWFGSATYDPPSLADGAGTTTTVTVTGAALGDSATATFSLDLQGITLTAWVSSANTVSVRFQNESGGILDLASGTLRASIERKA